MEKKIIIGYFRQRPQPAIENAIKFADSIDMVVGIECIYCITDISIIEIDEEEHNER
ncbi:MAG: hypothetical protein MJ059_01980 [Lachnospiraceae bacterium]|nr:hypothetical protein [Lachnospiraceae bacterium]